MAVRVVAVQPRVALGEVDENLRHLEDLVTQAAREHSPHAIFLPESTNAPNVYHPVMRGLASALDGPTTRMLQRLAREHGCLVGGGFIAVRGADTRGTYCVAEPDGTVHFHDKDQPSMWENNYYSAGADPGIFETSLGPIGCANGFEWVRSRTAERLRGRVRLLAGGMCFPSYPTWTVTRPLFIGREHAKMLQWARETPPRMARVLGVPCVHPSHVGEITMRTPLMPGVRWPTIMVGQTQICDRRGTILEHLGYEDAEGYVAAEVELTEPAPLDPVPPHFWMSSIPVTTEAVWLLANVHGRAKYEAMKRLRLHPWQRDPPPPAPAP
ncbi:MAG TPA: carbon-nitrogen hydrolase family protein [Solirubrobacteraceae bacterium]|nr:carbon-nitrogen hydrolase family protein [Solirubrobacteraceae bacterium]